MSVGRRLGAGRPRYGRVVRLPSVRACLTIVAATVVAVSVAAASGPPWAAVALTTGGAVAVVGYLRRHRHRVAVETHLVRALVRSGGGRVEVHVPELTGEVHGETTNAGVTRLHAPSWLDAVRAAGFVMARDRGFQMDLLRRTASGRLASVLGRGALASDKYYRSAGLASAATRAATKLEAPEQEVLTAFAQGVNAAFAQFGPPFECRFLSYEPERWTIEDGLLIALYMFHSLSWKESQKRADAVIQHVFPEAVARFFLPRDRPPPPRPLAPRPPPPRPPAELARFRAPAAVPDGIVQVDRPVAGSNCWAVRGAGAPLLACDLHLPLMAPNILYELDLRWPGGLLRGLAVVGIPVVLTGTNGRVAWGVTDLSADVLDFVAVDQPTRTVRTHTEHIAVRGGRTESVEVASDGTMPVSRDRLLGTRVAIRWTGHDPRSCDLRLQRLAHAGSVQECVDVIEAADGIPLNVLVADDAGRMAHLAAGLIPRRPVGERSSVPDGYLTGAERPRLVDPPSRTVVSANDAALPEDGFRIGYDVDPGHRADRIGRVLTELTDADPAAMRALQHDTVAELYRSYRDLALSALAGRECQVARLLAGWDGRADAASRVFGILVRLRTILAERVLSPYLTACRDHDPTFIYAPSSVDVPLLAIVGSGEPALLPPGEEHRGWPGFIVHCVDDAVAQLRRAARGRRLPRWGALNAVGLDHPLTPLARWAGPVLNVHPRPQPGALHCVRTCAPGFGAAGRAVLSPGADAVASFDVPGGQSGHPLSRHFADRHRRWAAAGGFARRRPDRIVDRFVIGREPGQAF